MGLHHNIQKYIFLYTPSFSSWETNMIWTLSSVVVGGPWRTLSVILAETDCAVVFIKAHYTCLTAAMDIVFGGCTQNSVRNDNMYMNLHHFIIRGHRGQLQTSKIHW